MRNTLTFHVKRLHVLIFCAVTVVAAIAALFLALQDSGEDAVAAGERVVPPTREVLPGAEERDEARLADLVTIEQALEDYAQRHDSVPSTDGRAQTLCTYEANDKGCELRVVLTEIPHDPIGGNAGYFYQSDGEKYIVISIWEGTEDPPAEFACPDEMVELAGQSALVCVTNY